MVKVHPSKQKCFGSFVYEEGFPIIYFQQFQTEHPEVKPKAQYKVSLKRGLRCTLDIAINYLDQLAALLIETGIAPTLWVGAIDATDSRHTMRLLSSILTPADSGRKKYLMEPVMIATFCQRKKV